MSVHSGWTNSDTVYGLWAGTLSGETCPNESWPTAMVKRRSETDGAAGVADGDALGGDLSEIRRACRAHGPLEAQSRPGLKEPGECYAEWLVKNKTRPVQN